MAKRYVIEHTATTTAAGQKVHALLTDSAGWPSWSPIRSATVERPAGADGTGEVRTFRTGPFVTREEVIVNDPPLRYSYRLISGMPVRNYRSDITIEPTDGGSRVTWYSEFDPRWPGSGAINKAVLSRFVALMLRRLVTTAGS